MSNYDIMYSFALIRLLFSDNYKYEIDHFDDENKYMFFQNICYNILADQFFTKFDKNVCNRLYDILNYFRDIYKDEKSYELINEAISVLNDIKDSSNEVYCNQFNKRYETVFPKKIRKKLIKQEYEIVKSYVKNSILNDMPFFYDINFMGSLDFNEKYGLHLTFLTNVMYLINYFPSVLYDKEINLKMQMLLNYNIDYSSHHKDEEESSVLLKSSILTLDKIYKKR